MTSVPSLPGENRGGRLGEFESRSVIIIYYCVVHGIAGAEFAEPHLFIC